MKELIEMGTEQQTNSRIDKELELSGRRVIAKELGEYVYVCGQGR